MYWTGWIDFFNETYMSMAISFLVNISVPTMNNASEIGNNTFALVVGIALVLIPIIMACIFNKGLKANEPKPFINRDPVPQLVTESNSESVSTAVREPMSA
jgi:hypothetical protein